MAQQCTFQKVWKILLWNLATTWKNKTNQNAKYISEKLKTKALRFFVSIFFHVNCKISNSNMWTKKHLAQASCAELTLAVESPHLSLHILRRLQKVWKNLPAYFEVISNKCKIFFKLCVLFRKSYFNLAYVCIAREFTKATLFRAPWKHNITSKRKYYADIIRMQREIFKSMYI